MALGRSVSPALVVPAGAEWWWRSNDFEVNSTKTHASLSFCFQFLAAHWTNVRYYQGAQVNCNWVSSRTGEKLVINTKIVRGLRRLETRKHASKMKSAAKKLSWRRSTTVAYRECALTTTEPRALYCWGVFRGAVGHFYFRAGLVSVGTIRIDSIH